MRAIMWSSLVLVAATLVAHPALAVLSAVVTGVLTLAANGDRQRKY